MDAVSRTIAFTGLLMFVFGLAFGFALKALPNPRAALSAHLNAVQSGTFMVALSLLWPKLAVWPGFAAPAGHAIWIAFWLLEVGMVLAAFAPSAEAGAPTGAIRRSALAFQGVGSLVMIVALGGLLFTF